MTHEVEIDRDGCLRLREPVELPEVLDVLIVGGGPGGTAAAFRAKERGLSTLVIEHDDILKRIRDYSKDKLILPGFGGGDRMRFPMGGELVLGLRFAPIDKDDMHLEWRRRYVEHCVPAHVGIELTGLERLADGTWQVAAWNHRRQVETGYRARHVVLAIGRGVPRRFDIPGNTDGIAFRLHDPADYVGVQACVIGGGTSAAEAVIAISNAKAAAGDPTAIHWSYRGDKMPRVSRALSQDFFDAYIGNGNVRYHPRSEPAAVVAGTDRRDYLAIRVDRRHFEERPNETMHLEFDKRHCIACIGEDIPEKLLDGLGVHMVTGGPRNKKRMVVTPLLETVQPNLYLVGDILAQAYLETEDFDADPAGFRELRHRGNVKSALRDGVLVIEVIERRLRGEEVARVELEDADDLEEREPARPAAVAMAEAADADGPPEAAQAADRRLEATEACLVRMLPGGVEEEEYALRPQGITTIGRRGADLCFPDDSRISDSHASVSCGEEGYAVRDDGGRGGVLLRLRPGRSTPVPGGTLVRLGHQFLVFEESDGAHACVHYDAAGREIGRHELSEGTVVLGRAAPDITLDAKDGSLSRRHLSATVRDGKLLLKDLESLNGTYLKVRSAAPLAHGDRIQVGGQELQLMVREAAEAGAAPGAGAAARGLDESARAARGAPAPGAAGAGAAEAAAVTFDAHDRTFPLTAGRTVCDVAEQNEIPITAECHAGVCGSDPVRILSGAEHLEPPSDGERETLEDICDLEPGPCRLACMLRPRGPVVVAIVEQDE